MLMQQLVLTGLDTPGLLRQAQSSMHRQLRQEACKAGRTDTTANQGGGGSEDREEEELLLMRTPVWPLAGRLLAQKTKRRL